MSKLRRSKTTIYQVMHTCRKRSRFVKCLRSSRRKKFALWSCVRRKVQRRRSMPLAKNFQPMAKRKLSRSHPVKRGKTKDLKYHFYLWFGMRSFDNNIGELRKR